MKERNSKNMIKFKLTYSNGSLELPINPEDLQDGSKNNNRVTEIISLGEIAIPGSKKLKTWTISSLFWADKISQPAIFYKQIIEKLNVENKPFKFVVEGLGIDERVIIDEFICDYKAGEEQDIYYKLVLTEAPVYGAKKLEINHIQKKPGDDETNMPAPPIIDNLEIGQDIFFLGGPHYHTSTDSISVGNPRTPGNARITNIANGRVHIIGTGADGSNVHGWVDLGQIRGFESVPVTTPTGNVAHPPQSPARAAPINNSLNSLPYITRINDTIQTVALIFGIKWSDVWVANKSIERQGNGSFRAGEYLRVEGD
jgi:hypothetical protein